MFSLSPAAPGRVPPRGFAVLAACLALLRPAAASAHAGERMVILTLPTGYYSLGAALVVALTALIGALLPRRPPRPAPRPLLGWRRRLPSGLTSWLAALLLWALILNGFFGTRDPLGNLLVLAIWTLLWVGLPLLALAFGDVWRPLNPWRGPVRSLRRLIGRDGSAGLARLGHWPAVAGLFGFAWFEIVSLAPADPAVLARVVAAYWLLMLGLAVIEGEAWLERGEFLTVYFGFIARIAPLWVEQGGERSRLMAALPGARILAMPPLDRGQTAFVALMLASVTFDGLSESFWWLARLGLNPLDFPGRSAVIGANTAGLVATWVLTGATILGAVALGRHIAGAIGPFWRDAGPAMLAFLPIAAGYHAAHYLVALLTNGQYAVVAASDPFGRGWNPLGLPEHWVSFGFLGDAGAVQVIWNLQFGLILCAHLLAVLLGLSIAGRSEPPPTRAAHLPMTALMVAYTVLGLWLLSTPVAA